MATRRDEDAWDLWNRRLKESAVWLLSLGLGTYETVVGSKSGVVYAFCLGLLGVQVARVLDRVRGESKEETR